MPTWGLSVADNTRAGITPPSPPVQVAPRSALPPAGLSPRPQPFPYQAPPRPMGPPALGSPGLPMPGQQQMPAPPPALGSPGLPMPGRQPMPAAPPPRGPVTNDKWRMQQQIGGVKPDARQYAPPPPSNGLPDQAQRAAGSKQGPQMKTVGGYNFY